MDSNKPSSAYGQGVLILRIDAFYDGRITNLGALKRLVVSESERDIYGLREGDIVINRVNSREYLGKSTIIPALPEAVVFESNMMRFRIDPTRLVPGYLIEFLQTPFIKSQIRTRTKDAVNQSSINQQDVKSFRVNVPPLSLQQEFVHAIVELDALKTSHLASLEQLNTLFSSLQYRAFRGEL
jgi:type I restriction enzyme S subunit